MGNGSKSEVFYPALGRLREAQTAGSTTYPKWHYLYTFDRYGNLTAMTLQPDSVGPHPALSITVSATTNRITSSGFTYDAAGNMTNDAMNTYTYDAESRIKTGAGATYTYDGAGLRVKKVAGGTTTRYIFSGTKVVAEYVGTTPVPSSPTREYIYSGSALLASIEGSTTTYHHQDHLSVRVNTNTSGSIAGQQGHYPFGQSWYASSTTTKWQFTSYERDSESTLDYAIFRYDNSRLGRFMTPDPIAGSVANPQSLNRYAYALNDPVNLVDPLGLQVACDSSGYCVYIPPVVEEIVVSASATAWDVAMTPANTGTIQDYYLFQLLNAAGPHEIPLPDPFPDFKDLPSIGGPGVGPAPASEPESSQPPGLRAPTEEEYQKCVRDAQQRRNRAIRAARLGQVGAGALILAGTAVIKLAGRDVFSLEHLAASPTGALGAGGPLVVGGAFFFHQSVEIANAWDQYHAELIRCAGPVPR